MNEEPIALTSFSIYYFILFILFVWCAAYCSIFIYSFYMANKSSCFMLLITAVLNAVPFTFLSCSPVLLQVASCVVSQCNIYTSQASWFFIELILNKAFSCALFVLTSIRHASCFSISVGRCSLFSAQTFIFIKSCLPMHVCNSFVLFKLIGRWKDGLKLDFHLFHLFSHLIFNDFKQIDYMIIIFRSSTVDGLLPQEQWQENIEEVVFYW